jgi:hypothetical protein
MNNVKETKDIEKGKNEFPLIIEGKLYHWHHQYISGAEIKELANLPMDSELFLSISAHWKEESVGNDKKVDLALPETEQFFVWKSLPYTINAVEFSSNKQFIKGSLIRHQGNISVDEEIYLKVPKDWEDELIEDFEWIDLARPGKEQFESRKIEFRIIVNLKEKSWYVKKISYDDVVKLAYPDYDPTKKSYTVKYTDGPKRNPEGSMSAGDIIYIKNKMTFHVTATNKS